MLPLVAAPLTLVVLYLLFRDPPNKWESWQNSCVSLLFLCFNHYQVIMLIWQSNVVLPGGLGSAFRFWGFTNDILGVFKLGCTSFRDFKSMLMLKASGPVILACLALMTWLGAQLVALATRRPELQLDRNRLLNVFLSLIFTWFVGIISISLTLFKCADMPNGKRTLTADDSVVCFEEDWGNMLVVAISSLLVYGLGFCGMLISVIQRAPHNFSDLHFQMRWKFLFIKFRSDVYWWSLVYLAKGTLQNIGLVVSSSGVVQLYWIMTVTMLYVAMVVIFQPYRLRLANILDVVAGASIVYCCSLAAWLAEHNDHLVDVLSTTGIVVNFVPLVVGVGMTLFVFSGGQGEASRRAQAEELAGMEEAVREMASLSKDELSAFFSELNEWDFRSVRYFSRVVHWEWLGQATGRPRISTNSRMRSVAKRTLPSDRPPRLAAVVAAFAAPRLVETPPSLDGLEAATLPATGSPTPADLVDGDDFQDEAANEDMGHLRPYIL